MDNLNLSHDRDPRNVWDEQAAASLVSRVRSLDATNAFAVASGAAMALVGLRKRGLAGGLLTAAGGLLVFRGLTGHRDLTQARAWGKARLREAGYFGQNPNPIDEAAQESFPASDPPSH
jgi:hypothetical protein